MTKKHFIQIAALLNSEIVKAREIANLAERQRCLRVMIDVVDGMIEVAESTNKNFDAAKFREACFK